MTENTEFPTGVYLSSLDTGSAVDLETKSRDYRIEYLEGDRIASPVTRGGAPRLS